jgi:hypothetical protein
MMKSWETEYITHPDLSPHRLGSDPSPPIEPLELWYGNAKLKNY